MKRVLIVGEGSYVGTSVRNYLEKWPDRYEVSVVDTLGGKWEAADFSAYDTVYHVAGIAHSDVKKISEEQKKLYYKVNTDLAINVARKAKEAGVRQFIFMSSAIIYGESASIGKTKVITRDTGYSPANCYGDSKVQAEIGLRKLEGDGFRLVILRCPMIYGKGSKGNFPVLRKLAMKLPLFPKIENKRSMLYIGNLAEFVRLMIENEETGTFWPCNREWSNTSELVKMIAAEHGRKTLLIPGIAWLLKLLSCFTGLVNKAFGSLVYEEGLGDYRTDYRLYTLAQSIKETEAQR